ncbi:hypothetical protein ADK57_23270 [Streptomyces sp. MMG1533]|uniref:COG1470 family protein n=1 Tax=Streptomyces sp. MMG1533 TaxID=1415546 RepID=UPI0006AE017A|nr:hypothetical protein [Streptomyces sp. MMG1533]KOU63034.1 hypothetical protein ADK57_23270 [Streptomyces sp. MMG1533]
MPSATRVLCLSLLVLLSPVPTAAAADGWSLAPSGGGRPSFYGEGTPGSVLQDTVSVTNRGAGAITVRLHGTGVPVAFAETAVRVPARTRADVPFTVRVPPGDRRAEIVARDADGGTRRVGLQLRVTVPRLSALTVEDVAVHGDRITYELVNRGTTALVPKLAVRADGLFGPVLDRAPRTLPVELPPGRRVRLFERWPDRPALDAVDVRLTVTAADGAHDTGEASARFVPWGAVAGAGGAAAALLGAFVVVRRLGRRSGEPAESPRTDVELTGAMT